MFFLYSDTSPPDLTCPPDQELEAADGENYAPVEWEVPVPVDNSGVTVSLSVVPALVPPADLPIGKTRITYVATDGNKNTISCSFKIVVKGGKSKGIKFFCLILRDATCTEDFHFHDTRRPKKLLEITR